MIEPRYADVFTSKVFAIMRQLSKHKERYIRAWMLKYGADPRDVMLVTRAWSMESGSSFRVEFAQSTDPVRELIAAAREAQRHWDEFGYEYDFDRTMSRVRAALEHFKNVDVGP